MDHANNKHLYLVGCNHKNTPLEVREQFSLQADNEHTLYSHFQSHNSIQEGLILNTCNRVEFYCVGAEPIHQQVTEIFCSTQGIQPHILEPHQYVVSGKNVINHLFEVTSGLNSQMVGETEILGQVKEAFHSAREYSLLGPTLNRLFQRSFQAAKWARTHTNISKGQVSIGSVATDLASRIFGELNQTNILVIGGGDVAESAICALTRRGANQITIANRTYNTAVTLAQKYVGTPIELSQVFNRLHLYDIILCCTNASGVVLKHDAIAQAKVQRSGTPLFLVDLGMPRNIDPASAALSNTFLYNLDDLSAIANANLKSRQKEIERCKQTLDHKASCLWEKLLSNTSDNQSPADKSEGLDKSLCKS